jgi:hypothetical protein
MPILRALLLCVSVLAAAGCGGNELSDELTPDDIARQRAEDKQRTDDEDKAEREYQRKLRQQGS